MSLIPQETIRRKRDGLALSPQEIAAFIEALSKDGISEGQAAAFAMAVFFRGMNRDEMVALTLAMRDSGDVLSWSDIGRPVADKHSTGGVGDNVSLMLAPIVAACGLAVPMISGRGLGHTGGTLDKLEAIPGYNVMPDEVLFRRAVKTVGCAIIGQTGDLAPADRRLYAIRDVTATVDSIPLITASILSKKLAAGLQTLVLDVKVGNGAFMQSIDDARTLARALVDVAVGAGLPTTALITDMNQPLGDAAGNAVEIVNCLDFLAGRKAGSRLENVVLSFAAEMLVQAQNGHTGRRRSTGVGRPLLRPGNGNFRANDFGIGRANGFRRKSFPLSAVRASHSSGPGREQRLADILRDARTRHRRRRTWRRQTKTLGQDQSRRWYFEYPAAWDEGGKGRTDCHCPCSVRRRRSLRH